MNSFWDKQIERADQLAAEASGSRELLTFYAQLLRAQKQIYESFRNRNDWLPSGDLRRQAERARKMERWEREQDARERGRDETVP